MSRVKYITEDGLLLPELEKAGSKLVIADFHANWCNPCKVIYPLFEEMSKKYPEAIFLKVDADECVDTVEDYHMSTLPTFYFIKSNEVIAKIEGADPKKLTSKMQELATSGKSVGSVKVPDFGDLDQFNPKKRSNESEDKHRVKDITEDGLLLPELEKAGSKLVIADFHANWCKPCKDIYPVFQDMSKKYPDVLFFKVDADECVDTVEDYDMSTLPTFYFIKSKEVIAKIEGADPEKLKSKIQELATSSNGSLKSSAPDDEAGAKRIKISEPTE